MKHSGAEWVKQSLRPKEISPLGIAVADLLGDVFAGIYHLDDKKLRLVDWGDSYVISVQLSHTTLATWDSDSLTRLVVLSHDRCLRLAISARTVNTLQLMFHWRQRGASVMEGLPTMEEHLALIRRYYPAEGGHA
jgi:hypothetical protein